MLKSRSASGLGPVAASSRLSSRTASTDGTPGVSRSLRSKTNGVHPPRFHPSGRPSSQTSATFIAAPKRIHTRCPAAAASSVMVRRYQQWPCHWAVGEPGTPVTSDSILAVCGRETSSHPASSKSGRARSADPSAASRRRKRQPRSSDSVPRGGAATAWSSASCPTASAPLPAARLATKWRRSMFSYRCGRWTSWTHSTSSPARGSAAAPAGRGIPHWMPSTRSSANDGVPPTRRSYGRKVG